MLHIYHLSSIYLYHQSFNKLYNHHNRMDDLREIFCRYDMVCDNPNGAGVELHHMPDFFEMLRGIETDRMHLHDFYEIIFFVEGCGLHYVDFNQYPISPGSLFLISPGQIHSFDSAHDQKGIVLKVCAELFDDFLSVPYVTVPESDIEPLMRLFEAIEEELLNKDALGHRDALRSLVKLLMVKIRRCSTETYAGASSSLKISHSAFISFRKLVEENYARLHTVKDYARLMSVTPKTLTLYVRECSSDTPLELINHRIILEAKRLLRYSVLSVKEIAFRLGFDDPSYFVKFFKRIVKQSPADYRESLQQASS